MTSNSKYTNYFIFEKTKISCRQQNCAYFYAPKNETGFPTTALRKHLERRHPSVFSELLQFEKSEKEMDDGTEKLKQTSLKRIFSVSVGSASTSQGITSTKQPKIEESFKQWTSGGEMTERVDKAVISLICTAGLPFSFVEEPGFKNLLHIMQPQYKIRSRNFFVNESLPNMYGDMVVVVKKDVFSAPFVSLCIDSWSSEESTHSLLGVTCHFLKENFEPTHVLLAASPIKGSHTGDKIASLVAKVITNFGIDKKVHMVIRDNESAMQKATRIAGLESQHCSSHKIQLAIGDGLKLLSEFKEVIEHNVSFCFVSFR
uniref:BED-type domain-containing protein n=2 Tax=Meloidogyne incognita group TaxID=654580 RepID=A0A914LLK9_MELIC